MYRGWQEHVVFKDEPYTEREAWEWLISNAVFHPDGIMSFIQGKPRLLMRGHQTYSIRFLAVKWDWNKSKVERYLNKLKKADMIGTENETGQLVIRIRNYDKFQFMPNEDETSDEP